MDMGLKKSSTLPSGKAFPQSMHRGESFSAFQPKYSTPEKTKQLPTSQESNDLYDQNRQKSIGQFGSSLIMEKKQDMTPQVNYHQSMKEFTQKVGSFTVKNESKDGGIKCDLKIDDKKDSSLQPNRQTTSLSVDDKCHCCLKGFNLNSRSPGFFQG